MGPLSHLFIMYFLLNHIFKHHFFIEFVFSFHDFIFFLQGCNFFLRQIKAIIWKIRIGVFFLRRFNCFWFCMLRHIGRIRTIIFVLFRFIIIFTFFILFGLGDKFYILFLFSYYWGWLEWARWRTLTVEKVFLLFEHLRCLFCNTKTEIWAWCWSIWSLGRFYCRIFILLLHCKLVLQTLNLFSDLTILTQNCWISLNNISATDIRRVWSCRSDSLILTLLLNFCLVWNGWVSWSN